MSWVQRSSKSIKGSKYWLNTQTGESRWTRPHPRAQTPSTPTPPQDHGWLKRESRSHPGLAYFHNKKTGETRWEPPKGVNAGGIPLKSDSQRPSSAAAGAGASPSLSTQQPRRCPASRGSLRRRGGARRPGSAAPTPRALTPSAAMAGMMVRSKGGYSARSRSSASTLPSARPSTGARFMRNSGNGAEDMGVFGETRVSVSRQKTLQACSKMMGRQAMPFGELNARLTASLRSIALGQGMSAGKAHVRKVLSRYALTALGSLSADEFVRALQRACNMSMIAEQDLRKLHTFYSGNDGRVSIDTLLLKTVPDDYSNTRGIIDFPSGECGAASRSVLGRPDQIMMHIRNDLRRQLKQGKGLFKTLREMFDSVDIDGSGVITLSEFKQALRGPVPLGPGHEDALLALFRLCDADDSGQITFAEFEKNLLHDKPTANLPKVAPRSLNLDQIKRVFIDTANRVHMRRQVFDRFNFKRRFTTPGHDGCDWPTFHRVCASKDYGIVDTVALKDLQKLFVHLQGLDLKGIIPMFVLLQTVVPSDIAKGRGILDYPSDDPAGGAPPSDPKMALVAIRREVQKQAHSVLHNRYEELFDMADTDGSGEISLQEFKTALRGPHGHGSGHERALEQLFALMDTNKNGRISFSEFRRELTRPVDDPDLCEGMPRLHIDQLRTMFRDKITEYSKQRGRWVAVSNPDIIRRFFNQMCPPTRFGDKSAKTMTFEDFRKICHHRLNINNVNDSDLRRLFRCFDKDKSGAIDCDEFLAEVFPKDYVREQGEMVWDEEKVSLGMIDESNASQAQMSVLRMVKGHKMTGGGKSDK